MERYRFTLSNENINQYVGALREVCEKNHAERKMMLATCLSVEEILMNFQSHFGTDEKVQLLIRKRFGDFQISIVLHGECFDPLDKSNEDNDWFLLDSIGLTPKYAYFNGDNVLSFSLKCNRSKNEILTILLSLSLGLILGVTGLLLPGNILASCRKIVAAISDAIFDFLKMASLPVIFLCVIDGIIGGGTVSTFREKGLRILGRFFLSMLLMLLIAMGICFAFLNIGLTVSSTNIPLLDTLVDTVFSILPDNIITPFSNGDNIKVIMLGVIFGCAILSLNNKVMLVNQLTVQLKDVCSVVMSWIARFIPLLIVTVLMNNIWSGNLGLETLTLWKIVALYFATVVPVLLFMMFRVSRKLHKPLGTVVKTVLMPGFKGFSSGSSILCYYDMVDGLAKKMGISEDEVNFGIPLAIAFYQPIIVLYAVFVLFFVGKSGMDIDISWIVSFILMTFVTSVAAPPVSGGSVSLLAILFTTFKVSDPSIVMAYPLLMLMDYPNTGFRVMSMMLQVASEGRKAQI